MVAVLVAEDVGLDEVAALAAELLLEDVAEEGRVEVDLLVGRAVERPDLRGGLAAPGVHGPGERVDRGRDELGAALLGERLGPVLLERQRDGLAGAVLVVLGVGAGLAVGVALVVGVDPARLALALRAAAAVRAGQAAATAHALREHDEQDDDDQPADTASGAGAAGQRDAHRATATTAAAAGVVDTPLADVSLRVEAHGRCLSARGDAEWEPGWRRVGVGLEPPRRLARGVADGAPASTPS